MLFTLYEEIFLKNVQYITVKTEKHLYIADSAMIKHLLGKFIPAVTEDFVL